MYMYIMYIHYHLCNLRRKIGRISIKLLIKITSAMGKVGAEAFISYFIGETVHNFVCF